MIDRVIQQAISQVLQYIWEPQFSDFSFGFHPGRGQHDAIEHAKSFIEQGYRNIVDLDLEKFFDCVNHDRLMSRLATRITDKRVLALIRRYLNSGILIGGLVSPTEEGVPQGGPLSPLLSNVVLDELDKELERRGLRFVRYADDCVIYVRSHRAACRVKKSISRFITKRLKLKVNEAKSAVSYPWWRKYLGFSFTSTRGNTRIRIHSKSFTRFKDRVRELTSRSGGRSIWQVIQKLNEYVRGWWNYYRHAETHAFIRSLNAWIMRRLRAIIWKHWKNRRTRIRELKKRGIGHTLCSSTTGCARKRCLAYESRQMGYHCFAECLLQITWIVFAQLMICLDQPNRRMRTRMSGGVGGGLCKGAPYPDSPIVVYLLLYQMRMN